MAFRKIFGLVRLNACKTAVSTPKSYTKVPSSICLRTYQPSSIANLRSISSTSREKDNVDKRNILVYEGPLRRQIKVVKYISIASSAVGFIVQPMVLYDLAQTHIAIASAFGIISTIFLISPYLLHLLIKRYVIELRYDSKTRVFTAMTFTMFNRVKENRFTADDVAVPTLPGILSSMLVRNTPLFVDANMIKDPDAFAHMMGYDKPFDLMINTNSNTNKKNK